MSYKIIVDSCCDLTRAQLASGDFISVPLTIRVGDAVIVDDQTFQQADLIWRMRESESAPATACPAPQQYADAYDCGATDIYVVCLSAMLSGSHNSAEQGCNIFLEDHPEINVNVFNSCSASVGEVLTALKIRELASAGLPFAEVVAQVNRYIYEMSTMFVLETLEVLRKNGRLSRLQSIVTGTLKIKLLMGANKTGEICKRGQALSIKQALIKMVDLIVADENHVGKILAIAHCNCLDRAFEVKTMLEKRCRFGGIILCETGGISTVYANDGGIIVCY